MGTDKDNAAAHKEYADFELKVKRTVFFDNLSPQVTSPVLKTALGQFGNVLSVHFIPNYLQTSNIPQCALVEMENAKQARSIIMEMSSFPFMMSGMPRSVRAQFAEADMFPDRPPRPGRKIHCRWVDSKDPDFEVAKKLKILTRKHTSEASALLKVPSPGKGGGLRQHQLEEEENLARHQSELLKSNYKKYEMVDSVTLDGSLSRLAKHYKINASVD